MQRDGMFVFQPCCGKDLCRGCLHSTCFSHSGGGTPCPFCRRPLPSSDKETIKRIMQRVQVNDARFTSHLGDCYRDGKYGLQVDLSKAFELWLRAEELGSTHPFSSLGFAYLLEGVEEDIIKGKSYLQLAAMEGDVFARRKLAEIEMVNSPWRAYKHHSIAALGGDDNALKMTKEGYLGGFITKAEFAEAMRGYHKTKNSRSSKHRDEALAHEEYERRADEARKNR